MVGRERITGDERGDDCILAGTDPPDVQIADRGVPVLERLCVPFRRRFGVDQHGSGIAQQ